MNISKRISLRAASRQLGPQDHSLLLRTSFNIQSNSRFHDFIDVVDILFPFLCGGVRVLSLSVLLERFCLAGTGMSHDASTFGSFLNVGGRFNSEALL
jgi:hypothetical protein